MHYLIQDFQAPCISTEENIDPKMQDLRMSRCDVGLLMAFPDIVSIMIQGNSQMIKFPFPASDILL